VTLMVTPFQAELAAHAARIGRITLSLRTDNDPAAAVLEALSTPDLLGRTSDPVPVEKKRRARLVVEDEGVVIYRGTRRSVYHPPRP
jgi:Flp pilus assembly protein CpaB